MLKICNLYKSFGKNEVLKNIDFTINKGEKVVIIGPSGCGKSTFLRCINFIEKKDSGDIYFNDTLIDEKNIDIIRHNTGMVFQSFNLFNNLNVLDNIILTPTVNKILTKEEAIKSAKKYLNQFDLKDKINSYPVNLSGGEKQRVAIIRELIMNPELILFDEPTSALDPEKKTESLNIIKKLAETGIAVIVVTHDVNFIKDFATRVVFMENGKIVLDDETDKVLNSNETRIKEFLNEIK